jgi:hypothetical protein
MLSAVPGLGSFSGVLHLAARRPYVAAFAVAVLAAVAYTQSLGTSIPALAPPPVPSAPIVQHTPQPPVTHEHAVQRALSHRDNPVARQQPAQKQQPVV